MKRKQLFINDTIMSSNRDNCRVSSKNIKISEYARATMTEKIGVALLKNSQMIIDLCVLFIQQHIYKSKKQQKDYLLFAKKEK